MFFVGFPNKLERLFHSEVQQRKVFVPFGHEAKIFPTMSSNEVVKTANFFTVDYLLGSKVPHFTDTVLSNSPPLFDRILDIDIDFVKSAFSLSKVFEKINKQPSFRPVTQIAALGERNKIRSPRIINIRALDNVLRIDAGDFRQELSISNYPSGLNLYVYAGENDSDMVQIANIILSESFISYGCDRQLHFPHPIVK